MAIPLGLGAGGLLPSREGTRRWAAPTAAVLALWIAVVCLRGPMARLDLGLSLLALGGVWVAWRLSRAPCGEGTGLAAAGVAVVALGSVAFREQVGLIASLSHMEVWGVPDEGFVSPLLWPEPAVGLGLMALPEILEEARCAQHRWHRRAARLAVLPLLAGLLLVGGPFGWCCAVAGVLWACAQGRWLGRPVWFSLLVIALVSGAYGAYRLPDRGSAIRNHAVTTAQAAVDARVYAWTSSLGPLWRQPARALLSPPGLGRGWPIERPVSHLSIAGVERTRCYLSDGALLTAELGWAGPGLVALIAIALMRARGSRALAGRAGAVAGGSAYALLVGHMASPINACLLLMLVFRLLDRVDGTGALRPPSPGTQILAVGGVVMAVLACVLAPAASCLEQETQANVLWARAASEGDLTAYRDAAQAYLVRWEAIHVAPWSHPRARLHRAADDYRAFCEDYAAVLAEAGDRDASVAYLALAKQLAVQGAH